MLTGMPRPRRLAATLALGLATSQFACATGAEHLVRSGVEGGVEGTLKALNDPKNQQLLRQLLNDPDLQKAAHDLTEAITGGALDGLTDEERMRRVREASDAYIRTVAAAVGRALNEDITPALTRTVESVVGGAVAAALRPENRERARSFIDGVTRGLVTAATDSAAQGLREDLGPALNKVIAEDLGPALQQMIQDNLGPALRKVIAEDLKPALQGALGVDNAAVAGMTRELTKQIVLGVNDGMSELGMSLSPNDKNGGLGILGWLAIVLGAVAAILAILLVRTILTRRALTQERQRSERMLLNVLYTIQAGEEGDNVRDLDTIIARARGYDPGLDTNDAYLANILARARLPRDAKSTKKP